MNEIPGREDPEYEISGATRRLATAANLTGDQATYDAAVARAVRQFGPNLPPELTQLLNLHLRPEPAPED